MKNLCVFCKLPNSLLEPKSFPYRMVAKDQVSKDPQALVDVGSHNLSKYLCTYIYIYIYIIPHTLWGDGSIVPNLINRNGCWSLLVTALNIVNSKCPYWKYDQSDYLYPKPPPSKLGTPLHYVATPLCQPSTAILGCGTLPRLPLPLTPGRRPHHQPRNGSVTRVFRFSMASMASNASMANCTVNVNPVFHDGSCFNRPFQGPCKSPTIRQRFSPCPPDNTKARLRIPSPGKHPGWCQ